MLISGTFLDEISHDIPHQNWGLDEWDQDFRVMRNVGIDTVILIRSGHRRWITYPSEVLMTREGCHRPPVDLVDMFLTLAEKYGMSFYFGTYDSGDYWANNEFQKEVDLNRAVVDEVWKKYGNRSAFKGWYLTQEVSRRTKGIIDLYATMGRHCKSISNNLPVLISPWIDGAKSVSSHSAEITKTDGITLAEHEAEWGEVMSGIRGAVDAVAFQDGHVDYHELSDFLAVNKALADKYGLHCWTNSETFDRDMPIKFLPIKWEKLLLKLEAAQRIGVEKAITFEFSHFLSPNSCYPQAHHLFDRYCEYFGLSLPAPSSAQG
ncbi:MAG: DUF4434 domain-containing protein [Anaerolineales bacterium]|nr:DUF4434 domain-containing protein [Anaerolineales bacterium]